MNRKNRIPRGRRKKKIAATIFNRQLLHLHRGKQSKDARRSGKMVGFVGKRETPVGKRVISLVGRS